MKYHNKKGYSVIISMLLIGFLLVLTTTVFNLVLRELNDTRGLGDSVKAFAGAEAAQELALLKIKEKGYGVDDAINHTINNDSIALSEHSNSISDFKKNTDVFISYDLGVSTNDYTETLVGQGYSIIPLFVEVGGNISYVDDYELIFNSGDPLDLVWNLVSASGGMSGLGDKTDKGDEKSIDVFGESHLSPGKLVSTFLNNTESYLILFNSGNLDIEFTITSGQKFSKPKTEIISSAQVGNYRHNLQTDYNNTEFLNQLKYSVFSN